MALQGIQKLGQLNSRVAGAKRPAGKVVDPLTLNKLLTFSMKDFRGHESVCIADVQYNPLTSEMIIEFHERGTYKYKNVPIDVYTDFETSGSQGQYFNSYIRNNGQYSYERIG